MLERSRRRLMSGTCMTFLIAAGLLLAGPQWGSGPSKAWAESHSGGGMGPKAGSGGGHDDGGHDDGHDDDGHDDGGHDDGGHDDDHEGGKGKGGHDDDDASGHDAIGGKRAGQKEGGKGTRGGGPVWSKEGIPEVELGRLNVARSPDKVLDRAFEEAKASFSASVAEFYDQDLDQMVSALSLNWDGVSFIDSPLQNLALLRDSLDGTSALSEVGIDTNVRTLQAAFLGTASDKEIPITANTVIAISTILGQPMEAPSAEALARDAEKIRIAILAGHG